MGNSLKWSAITLAVVAGVLIGFACTTVAYRHHMLRVPGRHDFVDRLDRDLGLNPEQRHQVQDLMRDTHVKMEQLHQDFARQHEQLIFQTHDHIRALLTPAQQQKFDREFSPPGGRDHHGPDD